jgi:hypothetical protein
MKEERNENIERNENENNESVNGETSMAWGEMKA